MSGPADYVLDTNVVIGFLAGTDWAVSFFEAASRSRSVLHISTITRMELLSFPQMTPQEEERISRFLSLVQVRPLNDGIEETAIRIRRQYRMRLPDAIVAATALDIHAGLVSADLDFRKVSELTLVEPQHLSMPVSP